MSLPIDVQTHEACKAAVLHTLDALRNDPRKFWLMGDGTETFEKLTTAAALIYGKPQDEVKAAFRPRVDEWKRYCAALNEDRKLLTHCRERGIRAEAA